jgi:acetyl esterase/lipase
MAPLLLTALLAHGQVGKPAPDLANVAYGTDARHVLDFWKASSPGPRPLAVYIHGGGFRGGDKNTINAVVLQKLLTAGISVAAIHYRLVPAHALPLAHEDSRRGLQFLRSKAGEWNIDKRRIGAFGGSAGAQICLWLAYHDDMAKPDSSDPVERESTRLTAIAVNGAQTTMDSGWWFANIPGYTKPHRPQSEYFGDRPSEAVAALVKEISALDLATKDDPPTMMTYAMGPKDAIPEGERAQGWQIHHVSFGLALEEKLGELGVKSVLQYPGANRKYGSAAEFLIEHLSY